MRTLRCLALVAAIAAAACDDDDESSAAQQVTDAGADALPAPDGGVAPDVAPPPGPDGGVAPDAPGAIRLVDWVTDLIKNHTNATSSPQSVDRSFVDTDDPSAFDSLLR